MRPGCNRDRRRLLQALCASAATAGCSLLSPQPLERPPPWYDPSKPRPPVVFLHGAFGARLRHQDSGREIWPIGTTELLVSSFDQLALPLDPDTADAAPDDIVAYDLFEEAGSVEFYGSLVGMLIKAGGYRRAQPGTPLDDGAPRLYACLYDWRRDLADAAAGLDALIEQLRADYGDPGLKVDLVAHSSGGLVARYYMLYGGRRLADATDPDFSGAAKVRRVVAIGVPELGITRAVIALAEGEPVVLSRVYPEVLATSYCTFQMLPRGDDVWLLDAAGRPLPGDSCDPHLWREFRLGIYDPTVRARLRGAAGGRRAGRERVALVERGFELRLQCARRFHEALRAAPVPASVPYVSIGGDCRPTRARVLVEGHKGSWHVRTRPEDVHWRDGRVDYSRLMLEDGDGTVPRSSVAGEPGWPAEGRSAPPLAENRPWQAYVCASHNQLVVNVGCQRALLRALGGSEPA